MLTGPRYTQLLSLVSKSGDGGGREFEAHKLTRLYDEIIQAALGSRWVLALTLASSIEALLRLLVPKGTKAPQADLDAISELAKGIKKLPGDDRLKAIACRAVHRDAEFTPIRALRDLRSANAVSGEQVKAWDDTRNSVMHGSLVSPYSSEEGDANLQALAGLMRALTREILRKSKDPGHKT